MKIALKFVELHTPLFLAGTNHGVKIKSGDRGVALLYDRAEKELLVFYKDEVAIVPSASAATMIPESKEALGIKAPEIKTTAATIVAPAAPKAKVKAQVGGPMDHVHAGPGAGKARD